MAFSGRRCEAIEVKEPFRHFAADHAEGGRH